jgi:hypothetical protein
MTPTSQGEHDAAGNSADRPDRDHREGDVTPHNIPAPSSPAPDEEAVRKGEDNLDSIVPK